MHALSWLHAGVEDFICNWLGNSRWLAVMPWSGLEGYTAAPEENILLPNGTVGGTVKAYKNLSFIKVGVLRLLPPAGT